MSLYRSLRQINSWLYFCRQGERITNGLVNPKRSFSRGEGKERAHKSKASPVLCEGVLCPDCKGLLQFKGVRCVLCNGQGVVYRRV